MLDRLSHNEQKALMELLIFMAKADGQIKDVENEVLRQYAHLVDVDFSLLEGNYTPEELIPQFERASSLVVVMQELLRLSHIDGHFSNDEKAAILDVAAHMGMSLDFVDRIDAWVQEGLRWVWKGEELLDEAESTLD